jgi:hypothetical protein
MHNDAPTCPPLIVHAIDFEGDRCLSHGSVELGAYGRTKDDSSVMQPVVNGEDLGLSGVNEANPPNLVAPEEAQALGMTEDFHTGVVCRSIGHGLLLKERTINIGTLTNLPIS